MRPHLASVVAFIAEPLLGTCQHAASALLTSSSEGPRQGTLHLIGLLAGTLKRGRVRSIVRRCILSPPPHPRYRSRSIARPSFKAFRPPCVVSTSHTSSSRPWHSCSCWYPSCPTSRLGTPVSFLMYFLIPVFSLLPYSDVLHDDFCIDWMPVPVHQYSHLAQ